MDIRAESIIIFVHTYLHEIQVVPIHVIEISNQTVAQEITHGSARCVASVVIVPHNKMTGVTCESHDVMVKSHGAACVSRTSNQSFVTDQSENAGGGTTLILCKRTDADAHLLNSETID